MKPLTSNVTSGRLAKAPRAFGTVPGSEVPPEFSELAECLAGNLDRQLGYFGAGRYVTFRYEPRAEDVIWQDERSFGIATGAWQPFGNQIEPLAELYGVNVGASGRSADHVLLFDRIRRVAYFAPRAEAEAFLAFRRQMLPGSH